MGTDIIRNTRSVCPVCLKNLPANLVRNGEEILLEKTCPEHGNFQVPVWRGKVDFSAWTVGAGQLEEDGTSCPEACGICGNHKKGTCCALLEVTSRCNLCCRFCFADGGKEEEISFAELEQAMNRILALSGRPLLQLSGGEPTCREDLPELIALAKKKGFPYVQLNSNGLRIAQEPGYAEELKAAGLSFVFLQFDGIRDDIYTVLRGKPLFAQKRQCIENCRQAGLGVTLVPTVVSGINDEDLGDIVRFGISMAPTVRGVHFQPVSYFGRIPALPQSQDRYTLDQLLFDLCRQTGLEPEQFVPSRCDHPLCGFHGSFRLDGGKLCSAMRVKTDYSCQTSAEKNREYIARHWIMPGTDRIHDFGDVCDFNNMAEFVERARSRSFTLTAMAFQDAMNLNIERLARCSLHVYHDGKMKPFCANYLTAVKLDEIESL